MIPMSIKTKNSKEVYQYVGRQVFHSYPHIAKSIINSTPHQNLLNDFSQMQLLSEVFSDYYKIDFPGHMNHFKITDVTMFRIKFTVLCLYFYDQEVIYNCLKLLRRDGFRRNIARYINTTPSQVSQYISKSRLYMRAYEQFNKEINDLVTRTLDRIMDRNTNCTQEN